MTRSSFAWDLPRNLTIKCSLFCTKFVLKNLYLAKNSLYKKPLFSRETARGPENCLNDFAPLNRMATRAKNAKIFKQHLLLGRWPDFKIISQKCSSDGSLPKLQLLTWFRSAEQNGRQS